jgi:hypothetical protein
MVFKELGIYIIAAAALLEWRAVARTAWPPTDFD